jgi:single-strand DNA-binding protein
MNTWSGIGRLGRDPEVRNTGSGKSVTNFAIAVDYGFGERKQTSWIPIVAWEKTAELAAQYLVKGSQVAVEGRLQQRTWEDKNGNKQSVLEVVANRLDFLTKAEKRQPQAEPEYEAPADEDIPF